MSSSKILVVDDQPINVQLLKRKLERGGLEVIDGQQRPRGPGAGKERTSPT